MLKSTTLSIGIFLCLSAFIELNAQCTTIFPAEEDFDTFNTTGNPQNASPIPLDNDWTNAANDSIEWVARSGGTPSSNTGPSADHTLGNGNYLYVEASTPNFPNREAIAISPCYDISGLSAPYLYFWRHMYGAEMNSLYVDVIHNGGTPVEVWSLSGDQGNSWQQVAIDISAYSGDVELQFRAYTGTNVSTGWQSDIAIDDVRISELQSNITVTIVQDNYPNEVTWDLRDGVTNNIIVTGNVSGGTYYIDPTLCYVFTIYDSAGDGLCCGYGIGNYSVTLDGAVVASGAEYREIEATSFNCPPGFSCNDAISVGLGTYSTLENNYWYSFVPDSVGTYEITTCGLNTCDTKIWVYDVACNLINVTDNLEGTTYADDDLGGCGDQAMIPNAILDQGLNYYIRIGSDANDCNGVVTWSISYNGPVVGCMDPGACNYQPLATVSSGNCLYPGDPLCPDGPDLTINEAALINSLNMSTYNITNGSCYFEEGCLLGYGTRNVLRFATRIDNIGNLDYYIGDPGDNPQMFDTQNCHGHAHFAGYADYLLFDSNGTKIPVGHKNGYCVIDVGCFGGQATYGCSNMGISAQCYDVYGSGTTCNWIDLTDVPAGTYTLVVRTNWGNAPDALGRHETDYSNNQGQVCINLTWSNGTPSITVESNCPPYTDCTGQVWGDAVADCTGACDGDTKTGDLNLDGTWNMADAQQYVTGILGDDLTPISCTDLNNDGAINVIDAALVSRCSNFLQYYDSTASFFHYHPQCSFPRGWFNQEDTVTVSIGNFNSSAGYFDVFIDNPLVEVLGYELDFSGVTIQSVDNLIDPAQYPITPTNEIFGSKVIGLSYLDSTIDKNILTTPLCRINFWSLTDTVIVLSDIIVVVDQNGNPVVTLFGNDSISVNGVSALNIRVLLEGPYNTDSLLMGDALRRGAYLPNVEPYVGLGFAQYGQGGNENVELNVFNTMGNDAIVDWIMVEIRDKNDSSIIVSTRSALLQRDGDIVDLDGVGALIIWVPEDDYFISVRHRNHLGVMSLNTIHLSSAPITVDFSDGSVATYGVEAQKEVTSGVYSLWAGNAFADGEVKYTGINNDRDAILVVIGGAVSTATISGYYQEDVTMEGVVKYTGLNNDRDPILVNIGGATPSNIRVEQLP